MRDCVGTCLVYRIDELLAVVPREVPDYLYLIAIREDLCDQRNALVLRKGTTDQPLPGWVFAGYGREIKLTNA